MQVVHGSQWWVLSRDAALHLLTHPDAQRLWRYLKHTHVPDESFFPVLWSGAGKRTEWIEDYCVTGRRQLRSALDAAA